MQSHGLKVVAVLDPNSLYADPSDPAAASNFCAWLAKTEGSQIGAIEVCNEPKFLDPLSGESVPVGSYGYSEAGTQLRIDNFR